MAVTVGSVWRPTHGSGGKIVVRALTATQAVVEPWPPRARRNLKQSRINLTAGSTALTGYVATGERG